MSEVAQERRAAAVAQPAISPGPALTLEGALSHCREVTRARARTFYFASHLLPKGTRAAAYAVYAFCRVADDAVDAAPSTAAAHQRLAEARALLDRAYGGSGLLDDDPVVLALCWAARAHGVPREPLDDLLTGMALDLTPRRLRTWAELRRYCELAAGTVGRALAPALGADRSAAGAAEGLGVALQLTNILRDIDEDLGMGRVYLPAEELAAHGLSAETLLRRRATEPLRALLREQIERARTFYALAERGLPLIRSYRARLCVRAMGVIYGEILEELRRRDLDPFAGRAQVSTGRKLWLLLGCFFGRRLAPRGTLPAAPRPLLVSSSESRAG